MRTEISLVQRLVRKPDREPAPVFLLIELYHRQTCPVHCNRVSNVTIPQDWCRVSDGQCAPSFVALDVCDRSQMLNLQKSYELMDATVTHEKLFTSPVNILAVAGGKRISVSRTSSPYHSSSPFRFPTFAQLCCPTPSSASSISHNADHSSTALSTATTVYS